MQTVRSEPGRDLPNRALIARLHPSIYKIIIGLVVWTVLAAWGFGLSSYSEFYLTVVTLFLIMATGLVTVLWRISRRGRGTGLDKGRDRSFDDWLRGEVDTGGSTLRGRDAFAQILLPIGAAAVGMTILMLVLHFDLMT